MQRGLLVEFSCNSPTLYLIALLRALLVVRSFVLEWQVVATTLREWFTLTYSNGFLFHLSCLLKVLVATISWRTTCYFYLFLPNYLFIFFCASFIDFIACSQLFCSPARNSSTLGNSNHTTRSPFHKCLPKFSSNGCCINHSSLKDKWSHN